MKEVFYSTERTIQEEQDEGAWLDGFEKNDMNKRARAFKTIFDSSARQIVNARRCNNGEAKFYVEVVVKRLYLLVKRIKTAQNAKAYLILWNGFERWLRMIDYRDVNVTGWQLFKKIQKTTLIEGNVTCLKMQCNDAEEIVRERLK